MSRRNILTIPRKDRNNMKIKINRESTKPVYLQIADKIGIMIEQGELARGQKLPPERKFADELGVHRNTVIKAYQELIAEGKITASRSTPKGYFVENVYDADSFAYRFFPLENNINFRQSSAAKALEDIYWMSDDQNLISFGGIVLSKKMEKIPGLESVFNDFFNYVGSEEMRAYLKETERLKQNICKILSERNIYATPKNIQIVAETNQALHYLAELYLEEGDKVIIEEPCIADIIDTFKHKGIETVPVPLEKDGINMEMMEDAVRTHKPKFIYVMPNYQNPTGITMSLEKRLLLLEIAKKYNVPIIEDDYHCEFRYGDSMPPSLYMLDHNKSVVYIDSFTLLMPSGIKVGFAVCPADLAQTMNVAITTDETFPANIGQYIINKYIEEGYFRKQIEEIRAFYKEKRDLMCAELDKLSEIGVEYIKPDGGLVLWMKLPYEADEKKFVREAEQRGVLILPGWTFFKAGKSKVNDDGRGRVRLCFSNVTNEQIIKGIGIIGEILRGEK